MSTSSDAIPTAQLTDISLEKSGHQEAAEACKNTNEDLLDQLNAGKQKIDKLEKSNSECAYELVGFTSNGTNCRL